MAFLRLMFSGGLYHIWNSLGLQNRDWLQIISLSQDLSDCKSLSHSHLPLHWTSRQRLATYKGVHSSYVCAYNLTMFHIHCSDVLTRDTAFASCIREPFSACWMSSLVVSYCIHSEVWAVFAGRRTILAHGWCGWWKGRWWWTSWNRVKGWLAWSFLNATP